MFRFWKKKAIDPVALLGQWRLVRSEGPIDIGANGITIVFGNDRKLTYTIHESEKDQIISLTYQVSGNVLITDQPSHPNVERTKFSFEPNGQLLLCYPEAKAWFERVVM